MPIEERMWKIMQKRLGYSDSELAEFRKDPRDEDVLAKGELLKKTIILEAVEAHGCNSRHKVGDKLYFTGAGNLLTDMSPKKNMYLHVELCPAPDLSRQRNALRRGRPERDALPTDRLCRRRPAVRRVGAHGVGIAG